MLIADTSPLHEQLFLVGTPIISFLLGAFTASRWTLGFPVAMTVVVAVIASTDGPDPADMQGAGFVFTVIFGAAFILPWVLGRGLRVAVRGVMRWLQTRRSERAT